MKLKYKSQTIENEDLDLSCCNMTEDGVMNGIDAYAYTLDRPMDDPGLNRLPVNNDRMFCVQQRQYIAVMEICPRLPKGTLQCHDQREVPRLSFGVSQGFCLFSTVSKCSDTYARAYVCVGSKH